jgi:hypothetical protein
MATKSSVDGLWKYMQEREKIRINRAHGKAWPWTQDKILQAYKFTNVQREHDKTSKVFKEVYEAFRHSYTPNVLLYNCGVARYFGTAEFYASVGWQSDYNPKALVDKARDRMYAQKPVFTRAYVITNGGLSMPKEEYVVTRPLKALWEHAAEIVDTIDKTKTWEAGYRILHTLEGFGGTGFMCKEVLMDYIQFIEGDDLMDWQTFTPVGPGALRGLERIARGKVRDPGAAIFDIYLHLRKSWTAFHPLARALSCSDIQFCLCEYDKYERTRLGEGKPKNKYTHREDK